MSNRISKSFRVYGKRQTDRNREEERQREIAMKGQRGRDR